MKGKNKRLELRVDEPFLKKLQTIINEAAGIKSKAAAIEFAVDVAIKHYAKKKQQAFQS